MTYDLAMLRRLLGRLRRRSSLTPEELAAREEGRQLLEDKETYRALDRFGPRDAVPGTKRDARR
jgi:hypothetical protein